MSERLHIGCHLSSSKGYLFMGKQILSIDSLQMGNYFWARFRRSEFFKKLFVHNAQNMFFVALLVGKKNKFLIY